jgi:hypothetical protein
MPASSERRAASSKAICFAMEFLQELMVMMVAPELTLGTRDC